MENLPELKSTTLADGVENCLLEYIQNSGLRPGDPMPKEEELAANLNVSRHIVREGVSRLKSLGLLESRKRRGMIVSRPNAFAGVSKLAEARLFSPEECREFMGIRAVMELGMTDFVYEKKTPEKITELRKLAGHQQINRPELEIDFHSALFGIGGNRMAGEFRRILATAFGPILESGRGSGYKGITPTHHEICDTLENGSLAEFRQIMKDHLKPYTNW